MMTNSENVKNRKESIYTVDHVEKPKGFPNVRHWQYLLIFFASLIGYSIRVVPSVAIYAMTSDDPPNKDIPTYPEWLSDKNVILSSFFWGYICLQVGAGQLAKNYGPKLFLGAAIAVCSIFTALLPIAGAQWGVGGVIACRVIPGLMQGFLFPSVHHLLGEWAPIADRAKVATFVYTASILGTAIGMPVTGLLSDSQIGWPSAFYVFGGFGLLWSIIWFIYGSDSPSKHKGISLVERRYIEYGLLSSDDKKNMATPWKAILTSAPFWAILIAHCGQNWGAWTLLTEIPSYMQNIMGFKITSNSFLSALPYFTLWVLSLVISPIADYLSTKNITTVGTSRKIFNSIGFIVPAIALISLSFVGSTQKVETVFVLVIAVAFNAAIYCGFNVNHIDLSPNYAGTLMGITNSISNVFSLLAPLGVDALSEISGFKETDKELWTMVFGIAAAVYIAVAIIFVIAGSGEVQWWNGLTEKFEESDQVANSSKLPSAPREES